MFISINPVIISEKLCHLRPTTDDHVQLTKWNKFSLFFNMQVPLSNKTKYMQRDCIVGILGWITSKQKIEIFFRLAYYKIKLFIFTLPHTHITLYTHLYTFIHTHTLTLHSHYTPYSLAHILLPILLHNYYAKENCCYKER